MKILIIGGNGFLGTHLALELKKRGHKVSIYDLSGINVFNKKIKTTIGSIINKKKLEKVIKNQDVVYNYAAISDIEKSFINPIKTIKTNILGNTLVLDLCVKHKVKKFIFGSTIYVHSSQGSFYRVSKQASELIINEYSKKYNLKYTILRFGTIYGPGSSLNNGLSKIVRNAIRYNKLIYSGSKKSQRRFIHIKDSTSASIEILKKKYNNQNILITGDKVFKISKVLKMVSKILSINKKPIYKYKINESHYNSSPYNYKPQKDKIFFIKPKINLEKGIKQLILETNKLKKLNL